MSDEIDAEEIKRARHRVKWALHPETYPGPDLWSVSAYAAALEQHADSMMRALEKHDCEDAPACPLCRAHSAYVTKFHADNITGGRK